MSKLVESVSLRKVIIIVIAVIGFIILTKILFKPVENKTSLDLKPHKVSVSTRKAHNQAQSLSFEYYGQLRNSFTPLVTADVSGEYDELIAIKVGSRVSKNQRLGRINNPQLALDFDTKKRSLDQYLNSMSASVELDFPELMPAWSLYSTKVKSSNDYTFPSFGDERFQNYLENQGLRNQLNAVKKAQKSVSDQNVIASLDGVIAKKYIQDGDFVSKGKLIYELSSSNGHEIEIALRRDQLAFLDKQTKYRFKANGKEYIGLFNGSSPKINPNNYTVSTTFRLLGSRDLMAGEYLMLDLDIPICDKCIKVPTNAVYEDSTVYVLENDIITKKEVKIHYSDLDYTYFSGVAENVLLIDKYTNSQYLGKKAEIR